MPYRCLHHYLGEEDFANGNQLGTLRWADCPGLPKRNDIESERRHLVMELEMRVMTLWAQAEEHSWLKKTRN